MRAFIVYLVTMNPLLSVAVPTQPPLEYWEKTPELWKKVTEQRQTLVSAKNEDGRTHSNGVGLVAADVAEVWAFATNPEKIKKSSQFLKSFTWNTVSAEE